MQTSTIYRSPAALGVAMLIVFGTTGCATKKYVRQTVGPVESRVASNEKKTADHSSAIGELENNLSRTDEKALEADRKAVTAGQEAQKANQAAMAAATRADEARALAESTGNSLNEVVTNLDNYQPVTSQAILFPVNRYTLTKEAQQQLDDAVAQLGQAGNYVLEVQGFTDSTGSKEFNLRLAQRRADSVVRYLTVKHNVPLRKINVLGIGEDNFAADNKTREGRKQNRRVEVKVYALNVRGTGTGTGASAAPTTNMHTPGGNSTTDGTRSRTNTGTQTSTVPTPNQ
ncbi:MAG TPA: OmpA family protein [Bryobacteraceae bacterium]|nr:OmpA family protein [Bryobacteraceae bacterium]